MSKYKFNDETLSYEPIPIRERYKPSIIAAIIFAVFGLIGGMFLGYNNAEYKWYTNASGDVMLPSKHDLVIGSDPWLDSTLIQYAADADLYLARPEFAGTPITGDMLALACANAYDSTGILLPVELALAQCQWESGMGLKGKSPKRNPYNIGEYDSGTVMWFKSTFDGVQAYYYFMCKDYLKCSTLDELFTNFVNCSGHRYASGEYEEHVPQQYYYIKKWLDKNRKKAGK